MDSDRLSLSAKERLQSSPRIAISTVSIYETMVAVEKGRLASQYEPEALVRRWMKSSKVIRIPVSEEIVIRSRTLKFEHADPFDRLIAGTAVQQNLPLMTADRHILKLDWLASIPAD